MNNIPEVKVGIIAVSRDCFPMELSARRREAVVAAYRKMEMEIYECPITVENEVHMMNAVEDVKRAGVNALVVYCLLYTSTLEKGKIVISYKHEAVIPVSISSILNIKKSGNLELAYAL